MIWKAFLTGSRAYGVPRADSDVDVVVRMPREAVDLLIKSGVADVVHDFPQNNNASFRFGKMNLICCTSDKRFEKWVRGTAVLQSRAPVTRDAAIEVFEKEGIERSAGLSPTEEPKTLPPPPTVEEMMASQQKTETEDFPF